jgi:RNA polymerase sigma-70 factor (sigma-E family)
MTDRRQEFERFVAGSADELLRTAYLIAWDLGEAEDLVQESLVKVARRWPRVRRMEHPTAYARKIVVHLALDARQRRIRRRQELEHGGAQTERADPRASRIVDQIDARAELVDALGSLPPRQRAVLVLRYFLDLPEAEAAAALGCSVGTVKSSASRGLARLEQDLKTPKTRSAAR